MAWSALPMRSEAAADVFESLRERYAFTAHPGRSELPGFLGSCVPDAIAGKPGLNVAIEVKSHRTQYQSRSPVALRNRIVHGDLLAEPTAADVDLVLAAIESTLRGD